MRHARIGDDIHNMHADRRSAAVPAAVAGASRPRYGSVTIRGRGRLPHWELDAGLYFVTFRLAGSIPKELVDRVKSEREAIVARARQMQRDLSVSEQRRLALLFSREVERYLDLGAGACWLRDGKIAKLVADALVFFQAKRYRLLAWCVMPNHVHIVVKLFPGQRLAAVVHSWKSFTAKKVNRVLARSGSFWGREYYDHLVRDEAELTRIIRYVLDNPAKAGLKSWTWVWWCGQDARTTAGGTPAIP